MNTKITVDEINYYLRSKIHATNFQTVVVQGAVVYSGNIVFFATTMSLEISLDHIAVKGVKASTYTIKIPPSAADGILLSLG